MCEDEEWKDGVKQGSALEMVCKRIVVKGVLCTHCHICNRNKDSECKRDKESKLAVTRRHEIVEEARLRWEEQITESEQSLCYSFLDGELFSFIFHLCYR
uniref:Uncharacterized protein n=1 Tax=Timema bartmani TaxID=61472 RepID=A0A7R9EYH3_9NEOP|nr:unnamed protein product [Timema bartmani]